MSRVEKAKDGPPPKARKSPCASCPYRQGVPSGIWHEDEYDLLPRFDGEIVDQIMADATHLFYCHQMTEELCSGWVGCHGPENLLALRIRPVDESVWEYESPVPLFASGAEAAEHGKRDIDCPGPQAQQAASKIESVHLARNGRFRSVG